MTCLSLVWTGGSSTPRAIGIAARVFGEPMKFGRQMSKGTFCDLPDTPATSPTQLGAFPLKDFVAEP